MTKTMILATLLVASVISTGASAGKGGSAGRPQQSPGGEFVSDNYRGGENYVGREGVDFYKEDVEAQHLDARPGGKYGLLGSPSEQYCYANPGTSGCP